MIRITDPKDCCGCTACASGCPAGAISMVANAKGFAYPLADPALCTECGRCEDVCPLREARPAKAPGVRKACALRLRDRETLRRSSSGGAFFALVQCVIADGGVVFGADYDENLKVRHTCASTLEECRKFQGSKYSQSDLQGVFPQVEEQLKQGRKVLFSGTPCQCDGLLHYLGKPYDGLITVDIICNSVPSPRVYREYMDGIEARFRDRIDRVDMRDKTLGWGTMDSYRYHFRSGREVLNPKGIPGWQYVYESGLISRESCFGCRYTNLGRVTDFTIGDFWDIRNLRPELKSAAGTSVLLVNSEKAEALTDRIAEFADLWEVAEDAYLQPRLQEPTPAPAAYDEFWSAYFAKGCRKTLDRYFPGKSLPRRIASKLGKLLSH